MSHQKQVNWGILGAGKIAEKFAADLKHVKDANLFAVASRKLDSAKDFAGAFNVQLYYEGYENMLKNRDLDIVYIATPHVFHAEHALLCIAHKKAVLCEKPFAMNLNEVKKIVEAAQKNAVLVMEALWTAFLPHFEYVQNVLKNKVYGNIIRLEADFGFPADPNPSSRLFNKSLGGGSLLDIGIYPVFMALATLGKPEKIQADATFTDTGVDAACTIQFEYPEGVTALLKSTFLEETPTTATFYCETGTVKIHSRFHEIADVTLTDNSGNQETVCFDRKVNGYSYEAAHMTSLYKSGVKESPVMNFERSTNLMTLLDTIRQKIGLSYKDA